MQPEWLLVDYNSLRKGADAALMNMGTPENPESVEHWSNTAMFAQNLESRLKRQQSFWLFFSGCCGQCEGGAFLENILADVTAVKREADFGGFRPDILLERGIKQPIFLEFTHTSPPSAAKVAYCTANDIDLFELDGSKNPADSSLMKAHISPRNCRRLKRQRLLDLWKHMEGSDDPKLGIREDFRSPERQRREFEAWHSEFEAMREKAATGTLRCTRCDESLAGDDGGFSATMINIHKADGSCGQVTLCRQCEFSLRGGWDGAYPFDVDSWMLDEDCQFCKKILSEQAKRLEEQEEKAGQRRSVEMPEPYGTRLVQEPERRQQAYMVGNRTVSRDELLSILYMMDYVLAVMLKTHPKHTRTVLWRKDVHRVANAVLYANNMYDWDWLKGIGESYVYESDATDGSKGDKFLYPKRWGGGEVPPCPLLWP